MNKKLLKGSLAAGAAVLIAGGGATYAAFSDVETVEGNAVTAGVLDIQAERSGTAGVSSECPSDDPSAPPEPAPTGGELNPGCTQTGEFLVRNAPESTLSAPVHLHIPDFGGLETSDNGCANGTPSEDNPQGGSEYRAEPTCQDADADGQDDGELDEQSRLTVFVDEGCTGESVQAYQGTVREAADADALHTDADVAPGEENCYTYVVEVLSGDFNDAAQSDSFDMTLEWTTEEPVSDRPALRPEFLG